MGIAHLTALYIASALALRRAIDDRQGIVAAEPEERAIVVLQGHGKCRMQIVDDGRGVYNTSNPSGG
jgi:hypothetical protein